MLFRSETDSGLDVDALKVVGQGVSRVQEATDIGVLLITHTTRLLQVIPADFVHVFVDRATQRPAPVPEASRAILQEIAVHRS